VTARLVGLLRAACSPLGLSVALPTLLACGAAVDLGGNADGGPAFDAGIVLPKGADGGPEEHCGSLDAPSVPSDCRACAEDAGDCQPNGCYGGYWCDSAKVDCSEPPKSCP
jgi:hypothetical protein